MMEDKEDAPIRDIPEPGTREYTLYQLQREKKMADDGLLHSARMVYAEASRILHAIERDHGFNTGDLNLWLKNLDGWNGQAGVYGRALSLVQREARNCATAPEGEVTNSD